jgi:hypothetical protein
MNEAQRNRRKHAHFHLNVFEVSLQRWVGRNGCIIDSLSIQFSPAVLANYNSTKVCFAYFGQRAGADCGKKKA